MGDGSANADVVTRAKALLAAAEQMTTGPWEVAWASTHGIRGTIWDATGDIAIADITKHVLCSEWRENGAGIALLRNEGPAVIRELVAEIERPRTNAGHRQSTATPAKKEGVVLSVARVWLAWEWCCPCGAQHSHVIYEPAPGDPPPRVTCWNCDKTYVTLLAP